MQTQKIYRETSLGTASILWVVTMLLDSWVGWTVFLVASGSRTIDLNNQILGMGLFAVWAGMIRWIMLWRSMRCLSDMPFSSGSLIGLGILVGLVSAGSLALDYSFADIFLTSYIWIMVGGAFFGLLTGYLLDLMLCNS